MFELRVLNGLHEGAALPLSGDRWTLGNASGCELQLCDNGIKPHHCLLTHSAEGWLITPQEGSLCNRDGEAITAPLLLQPGDIFTLVGVWLSLSDASTPWGVAPAVPAASPVVSDDRVPSAKSKMGWSRFLPRWAQIATVSLLLLLALTVTSWVLQPGMAQQNESENRFIKPQLADTAALRSVVEQKLRERELLHQVQLTPSPNGITLAGDLSPEQLKITRRMVKMIKDNYQLGVALDDETRVKSVNLPFRIIQITAGSHANIVTDGGQRLFVGDERDGLRLTAITADQVQFAGQENITVKW